MQVEVPDALLDALADKLASRWPTGLPYLGFHRPHRG